MAVGVDWLSPTLSSLHFLRSPSAGVKCVNAVVRGTRVVAVTCGGVGAGFTLANIMCTCHTEVWGGVGATANGWQQPGMHASCRHGGCRLALANPMGPGGLQGPQGHPSVPYGMYEGWHAYGLALRLLVIRASMHACMQAPAGRRHAAGRRPAPVSHTQTTHMILRYYPHVPSTACSLAPKLIQCMPVHACQPGARMHRHAVCPTHSMCAA